MLAATDCPLARNQFNLNQASQRTWFLPLPTGQHPTNKLHHQELSSQIPFSCFYKLVLALPVVPPLPFFQLTQMREEWSLIGNMDQGAVIRQGQKCNVLWKDGKKEDTVTFRCCTSVEKAGDYRSTPLHLTSTLSIGGQALQAATKLNCRQGLYS